MTNTNLKDTIINLCNLGEYRPITTRNINLVEYSDLEINEKLNEMKKDKILVGLYEQLYTVEGVAKRILIALGNQVMTKETLMYFTTNKLSFDIFSIALVIDKMIDDGELVKSSGNKNDIQNYEVYEIADN